MKNSSTQSLEEQLLQTAGAAQSLSLPLGLGVDVEELSDWKDRLSNEHFLKDNYSEGEREYCKKSFNSIASLAGLWCAKEAVLKAMSNFKPHEKIVREFAQNVDEVEIFHSEVGCPLIKLKGKLEQRRQERVIQEIKISISHSEQFAIAVAICL